MINQPPHSFPPAYGSAGYYPPSKSVLAIFSLILGILSFFLIAFCGLSIFTAPVSILFGHIGLYQIKRSAGRLEGHGLAIAGLVTGYLSLVLTIAFLTFLFTYDPKINNNGVAGNSGQTAMGSAAENRRRAAERDVMSAPRGTVGFGNTQEAREIAQQFAISMKALDEEFFTSNKKPLLQLSGGNFLTHCELHPSKCAFIVHVPSYKKYDEEAKEALANIAWRAAISHVSDHLEAGDQVAVGLRGTLLYGDVMFGTYSGPESSAGFRKGDSDELNAFFETPALKPASPSALEDPSLEMETTLQSEPIQDASSNMQSLESSILSNPHAPTNPTTSPNVTSNQALQEIERMNAQFGQPMPEFPSGSATDAAVWPGAQLPPGFPPPPPIGFPTSQPNIPTSVPKLPDSSPETKPPAFQNTIPVSLEKTIDEKGWTIESLLYSPDGKHLYASRIDQTISVFDVTTGARVWKSKSQDDLGSGILMAQSFDGRYLLASGFRGSVLSYRIEADKSLVFEKSMYKHNRAPHSLTTSPTYPFVLSGGQDGVLAWHPFDDRSDIVKTNMDLKDAVLAVSLPTKGSQAMATDGRSIMRFSLQSGDAESKVDLEKGQRADLAAFNADGSQLVLSQSREITLVDSKTGMPRWKSNANESIRSLAFHPSQPWIMIGLRGRLAILNSETSQRIAELDTKSIQYVKTIAFSPDADRLAITAASAQQPILIFNLTK